MSLSRLHDPYEVLGVSVDATVKEITTAYRKLSLQYHPDKHPDLEEHYQPLFVKISNAYEVLRDTDKRNEYNRSRQHSTEMHPAAWPSFAKPSTSRQHRDNGWDSKVWEEALSEREARRLAEEEQRRQAEEELEAAKQRWKEEWGYQDKKESDMEAWRAAAQSQPDSQDIWERAETVFGAEPWEADELSKGTDQWMEEQDRE